jgi:putative endonuclease
MAMYVYILASRKHGTLYLGVTSNIVRRVYEHRTKVISGFTARYAVDKLVWFEIHDDAISAISREKKLKTWRRDWKFRLIVEQNPEWIDLYPGILQLKGMPVYCRQSGGRDSGSPEIRIGSGGYGSRARPSGPPRNDEVGRNDAGFMVLLIV